MAYHVSEEQKIHDFAANTPRPKSPVCTECGYAYIPNGPSHSADCTKHNPRNLKG
jgi:hypothetical protein